LADASWKDELRGWLGREPTATKLKDGRYLADYFLYKGRASELIADSEEEAISKLHSMLSAKLKKQPPPAGEPKLD
jgi:hypothetical protein